VRALLIALLVVLAWVGGYGYSRWYGPKPQAPAITKVEKKTGYHCPMHPNFRSDHPGVCGICGMKLVPDADAAPAPTGPALPAGAIHVSPDKQQLIGVTFGTAEYTSGAQSLRVTGKIQPDETRVVKVQTRIDGWIEKVFVDFTGKYVEKGQPLLTLYSPELLASQQEYLLALKSRELMKSTGLVQAARKRLDHWSLTASEIDELERTGEPVKNVTLHAPVSGYVMVRNAFPKQRVTPETELYTLIDLSRVWVMAEVFESDAPHIRMGAAARITLPSVGARAFNAVVTNIQPQVEMATRTIKVRLEADNPDMALRPDTFVDVVFQVGQPTRLTVPAKAVLDAGLRKTVFVDLGDGHLEPRQVETGERLGDRIEILRGLKAGERIVASGTFLIDSESQLKHD
jgi:membrane fusion protein, copper/silver efflux system